MSQVLACLYNFHQQQLDSTFKGTVQIVRIKDVTAADFLVKAEKSWERFAEASCDYTVAASPNEIPEDARFNCWATLADARIKVLRAYRSNFLDKHPK